jgi:hypothetical protein
MFRAKDGETRPAIITKVWNPTCVNLHVFGLDNGDSSAGIHTSVTYAETWTEQSTAPTWHWPVREA